MFAALHLPDFIALAVLRARPEVRRLPYAVLDVAPDAVLEKVKLPLLAVNDRARQTGIDAGWPLNRALVRCPDLLVLPSHPPGEAELLREMIEQAESLTPDLEIASKDTLLLDLSRCTSRQAAGLGWLEMSDGELHYAKAPTPDLARLAVRHDACHGRHVTPADLKPLPLGLLGWLPGGAEMLSLLKDWGLSQLGDFMALPRQDLIERLGPVTGEWHDLLHAKTCRLLRLHRPPESLAQTLDFEDPVTFSEPLVFAFKRLLHALSARLAARHVAVKTLRLAFHLESGALLTREIRLPEPRVAEEELLRPVQVLLDSLKPPEAIMGVTLDADAATPTAAQRDWFIRQLPRPEQWADTLALLEALLGPGKVGIPVPPASHRPDDFQLRPADGGASPSQGKFLPSNSLPLRRLRPAPPVIVAADAHAQPRPLAILSGPCRGQVVETRGPFRHSGHWWDPETAWQRIEWDVRLAGDQLVRLAFTPPDRWVIDGLYQ